MPGRGPGVGDRIDGPFLDPGFLSLAPGRRGTISRLFILTGSISRDIRYAGTVTRVILLRVVAADTPGFFAADGRLRRQRTSVIGGRLCGYADVYCV